LFTHTDVFARSEGGTAGAVLASRLSEVESFQVLVIEAGPRYARSMIVPDVFSLTLGRYPYSNEGVLNVQVPFFDFRLRESPYDWNFTTTPQKFAKGRVVPYARGRILGGSSSISGYLIWCF
jgi:choline dehydrogenase